MTPEEHGQKHLELHHAVDELLACWIGENSGLDGSRRASIHDEVLTLVHWAYLKTLEPSPVREDASYVPHSPLPDFLIAQSDDPELLEWLNNAECQGGGFVHAVALAGLRADHKNYPLMRPLLVLMRLKYPEYEPSAAVKEEIRGRKS